MADRHRRGEELGVAAAVKQTAGAIGYVEQAYALENGFTYASVKNSAGKLRPADDPRHLGSGERDHGSGGPRDLDDQLADPAAYPIVSQTFLDAYKDPCKDGGASTGIGRGAEVVPRPTRSAPGSRRSARAGASCRTRRCPRARGQGQRPARDDDLQRLPDL